MRYAVIDSSGIVENVVLWDGKAEWSPGEGLALVKLSDDSPVVIGDRIDKRGKVTEAVEFIDQAPPTIDTLTALLVEKGVLTEDEAAAISTPTTG